LNRDETAVRLKKSLAITPGMGRTDTVMAAACERSGRLGEAKGACREGSPCGPA
jgi:hypothetical protein